MTFQELANRQFKFYSRIAPEYQKYSSVNHDRQKLNELFELFAGLLIGKGRSQIARILGFTTAATNSKMNNITTTLKELYLRDFNVEYKAMPVSRIREFYNRAKYKYKEPLLLPTTDSISVYSGTATATELIQAINEYKYHFDLDVPRPILQDSPEILAEIHRLDSLTLDSNCNYSERQNAWETALELILDLIREDYHHYQGLVNYAVNLFIKLEAYSEAKALANFNLEETSDPQAKGYVYKCQARIAWLLYEKSDFSHQSFLDDYYSFETRAAKFTPWDAVLFWNRLEPTLQLRKLNERDVRDEIDFQLLNIWREFQQATTVEGSTWSKTTIKSLIGDDCAALIDKYAQDFWVVKTLKPWYQETFINF